MGCLFSQAGNVAYLHKAQSPYSVNMLAAVAARAAVQDPEYVAQYVTEVLAARDQCYAGLDRLGVPYFRSQANFVLFRGARGQSICGTGCANGVCWCGTVHMRLKVVSE